LQDAINSGFCGALETDYLWLTKALVGVANQVCDGRIVSVLEGGYRIEGRNVSAFARSVHDHVLALAESRPDIVWDGVDVEVAKKKAALAAALSASASKYADEGADRVGEMPTEMSAEDGGLEAGGDAGAIVFDTDGKRSTRRRTQVDYVKLNEELKESKKIKMEGA